MTNKITYNLLYRTKCQFIASTLYALGRKLDSTEWLNNECFFVFEDNKECVENIKKYYTGELKLCPRKLFDSFRAIKQIIFNK